MRLCTWYVCWGKSVVSRTKGLFTFRAEANEISGPGQPIGARDCRKAPSERHLKVATNKATRTFHSSQTTMQSSPWTSWYNQQRCQPRSAQAKALDSSVNLSSIYAPLPANRSLSSWSFLAQHPDPAQSPASDLSHSRPLLLLHGSCAQTCGPVSTRKWAPTSLRRARSTAPLD
jgi:hypothetical protein